MAIIIGKRTNLDAPIKVESLYGVTFTTEAEAHQFVVRCEQNGQELTLSGTVSAKFVRADGNTVQLVGSISDGAAVVTLAQDCYNVPGRFQLAVFNTVGNTTLCIYACIGTVQRAQSGNLIDGGGIIPDVEDLIADIQAAVQSIPPTYDELLASIAGTYSASKTYAVGDYVWYDGSLYRCTTAITTAEAWTAAHWTSAVLGDDLSVIKSALNYGSNENLLTPTITKKTNSAATDNGDGTIQIGTGNYGTVFFDSPLTLSAGEYVLFGVPQGFSFVSATESFVEAIGRNTSNESVIITINDAGSYYVGYRNNASPAEAFSIRPLLAKHSIIDKLIEDADSNTATVYDIAHAEGMYPLKYDLVDKSYVEKTTGEFLPASSYARTGYIDLGEDADYFVSTVVSSDAAYYDANKTYLGPLNVVAGKQMPVPSGAKYIALSNRTPGITNLIISVHRVGGEFTKLKKEFEPIRENGSSENIGNVVKLKYTNGTIRKYGFMNVEPEAKNKWGSVAHWFRTPIEYVMDYIDEYSSEWVHHIWATDMHIGNNNNGKAGDVCNYLLSTGKFGYIIYSGDIIDAPNRSYYDLMRRSGLVKKPGDALFALGNHDTSNTSHEVAESELFDYFLRGADIETSDSLFNYCAYDYQHRIKYVIFDTEHISSATLAWLASAFAVPSDWTVFMIAHRNVLIGSEMHKENSLNISAENSAAIKAAIAGCTGTFGGYLCGHQHIDCIDLWDDGTNPAWYQIAMENDKRQSGTPANQDSWRYVPTADYCRSVDENAITICSINVFEKKIVLFRIGAYYLYNKTMIDYANHTVTYDRDDVSSKRDSLIDFTVENVSVFNEKNVVFSAVSSDELLMSFSGGANPHYTFYGLVPGHTYEVCIYTDMPNGYSLYINNGDADDFRIVDARGTTSGIKDVPRTFCFTVPENDNSLAVFLYGGTAGTEAHLKLHLHEIHNPVLT